MVTPASVPGPDLYVSPRAEEIYPLAWEMKNVEKGFEALWKAYDQAINHAKGREGIAPIVCFSKNHAEPMVCLKLEDFLRLVR